MLDSTATGQSQPTSDILVSSLAIATDNLALWSASLQDAQQPRLVATSDLRASAEVLLADRVLDLLRHEEANALVGALRSAQQAPGHWLDAQGKPCLSLTVLAAWALRTRGHAQDETAVAKARDRVLEMGGAQRGSFSLRLWLAMAGALAWDCVPAVPSELWLLPGRLPMSAHSLSSRAQTYLTAYHIMASSQMRIHVGEIADFVLQDEKARAIAPRLTRPGLVGDLMQSLDRAIKLSRKLPRKPIRRASLRRARALLLEQQQEHGGWFSVRPTLWAAMALRGMGLRSDDPVLLRAANYLRCCRGYDYIDQTLHLMQGHAHRPMAQAITLSRALGASDLRALILNNEIQRPGPWQRKAECAPGGWPTEVNTSAHFDLWATCEAMEALLELHHKDPSDLEISQARRRAARTLLAMQERDGHFALFERGEASVAIAKAPWLDAEPLRSWPPASSFHVVLSARALACLHSLGWRIHDDRIARGVAYIEQRFEAAHATWPVADLAEILRALAGLLAPESSLRVGLERRLRARQLEDGSFGDQADTAAALRALVALADPRDPLACVQTKRAARHLVNLLQHEPKHRQAPRAQSGCGLARWAHDPAASDKAVHSALTDLVRLLPCAQDKGVPQRSKATLSSS